MYNNTVYTVDCIIFISRTDQVRGCRESPVGTTRFVEAEGEECEGEKENVNVNYCYARVDTRMQTMRTKR